MPVVIGVISKNRNDYDNVWISFVFIPSCPLLQIIFSLKNANER